MDLDVFKAKIENLQARLVDVQAELIKLRDVSGPRKAREFWIVKRNEGLYYVHMVKQVGLANDELVLDQIHVREVLPESDS